MTKEPKIVDNIIDAPKQEGEKGTRTVTGIENTTRYHYYQMEWSGGNDL